MSVDALDVELILETDRETMERAFRSFVLREVAIEGFCIFNGSFEEDLMQATDLQQGVDRELSKYGKQKTHVLIDAPRKLDGRTL